MLASAAAADVEQSFEQAGAPKRAAHLIIVQVAAG